MYGLLLPPIEPDIQRIIAVGIIKVLIEIVRAFRRNGGTRRVKSRRRKVDSPETDIRKRSE